MIKVTILELLGPYKRKILLVTALVIGSQIAAHSQVLISLLLGDKLNTGKIEFGLDGGVNFPDIRGLDEGDMKASFNLGFYFDIKLKASNWMMHTGVLVKSSMGASNLPVYSLGDPDLDVIFEVGEVRRKINYFNVPIAIKYRFENNFFLEAGIMPALRAKAYDIFTTDIKSTEDLQYKLDIRDQIHRLDFGLIGGAGYRLMKGNGMNITARYYYGLVDVVIDDSTANQYNTCLYLSVGIPIGAGKAREKMAEQ